MNLEVGNQLRVLQINVERISAEKSEYLARIAFDLNVDLILLQESHAKNDSDLMKRVTIDGFSLISALNDSRYGIATYMKSSIVEFDIKHEEIVNNIFVSTINVAGINITNVYKPPSIAWSSEVIKTFDAPFTYIGDFNSHHLDWGYNINDENGHTLTDWMDYNSLELVYSAKDKKTFHSARWT